MNAGHFRRQFPIPNLQLPRSRSNHVVAQGEGKMKE